MAVDAKGNQCPAYADPAVSPPEIVQVFTVRHHRRLRSGDPPVTAGQ
jgi:hypothetical protein